MHDKLNISFHSSDCPEENLLKAYHKGQLSHKEIHAIEEHLIDCEMCSDYLEGLSLLSGPEELEKETAIIVSKINSATSKKNRLWLYATAASIFIGISLFSIIWFLPTKTSYVADKLIEQSVAEDKRAFLIDSTVIPADGFIKNQNEAATRNKSQVNVSKVISQTVVDQVSPIQFEVTENSQQADYSLNFIPSGKEKESEQKKLEDSKNTIIVTSDIQERLATATSGDIQEKLATATSGENQNMVGGVNPDRGLVVDATGKGEKSEKKSNRKESKDKAGVAANTEVTLAEEAPALFYKSDVPGKEGDFITDDRESNTDLDKSRVFINQQMADSAVVYALRATISCDSCKWTAMFALSKAYIAAGQTEKAVATLKDIKAKAPSKYSKEAKTELEKLGY